MTDFARSGAVQPEPRSRDRHPEPLPITATAEGSSARVTDVNLHGQRALPHDILALQRAVGNQACQRLLAHRSLRRQFARRAPLSPPPIRTAVVQRNGLQPPADLANLRLADVEEVIKGFAEGSHAYLARIRGQHSVLKLSSEDAQAEAKTAFLAEKLGVPAARAGWLAYAPQEITTFLKEVKADNKTLEAMGDKMKFEAGRSPDGKGQAVVMELIEGKTLSGVFGLGKKQTTIPEGGTAKFSSELEAAGRLETFFHDLGEIAAFDIIIANKDRFAMSGSVYQGGLPKGNTGNFMYGSGRAGSNRVLSIDMDIAVGTGVLDESTDITSIKEQFAKWVERLKSGDYDKIVRGVLRSISEGEDDKDLHGKLMQTPQARQWITEGINMVLLRVTQLSEADMNTVFDTWKDQSEQYGQYLKDVLGSVKAARKKQISEPETIGTQV